MRNIFNNAETVEVTDDITASAYASYKDEPVIACILGTSSHACTYDGKEVVLARPPLGFILGSEGSGSYFGKKIYEIISTIGYPKTYTKPFQSDTASMLRSLLIACIEILRRTFTWRALCSLSATTVNILTFKKSVKRI